MSQRSSGFKRVPADLYQTPAWVIDALEEHICLDGTVWEPACGEGKMVRAIEAYGAEVIATDKNNHGFAGMLKAFDFLGRYLTKNEFGFDAIITNPPYGPQGKTAEAFIKRGLELLEFGDLLALLLPVDFDSAKTRAKYFADCPDFAAKIVLRRRIKWFEQPAGEKSSTPSANHAWFLWERTHLFRVRKPVTLYGPSKDDA